MTIPFVKMQGAANDFVVVDHRRPFLPEPLEPLVASLCDRRRGVGADGVLLLEADPELDFAMRYYNADGRPADYCGNGARCLARLALDLGMGSKGRVRFRAGTLVQEAQAVGDGRSIEVSFGLVPEAGEMRTVEAVGRRFEGRLVLAGVPHFVVPVDEPGRVPVAEWGAALRRHPEFGPAGANVDFVAALEPSSVAMRTFERGVEGETLACGSGAIASAVWALGAGHASPVRVTTAGGDVLIVSLGKTSGGWNAGLTGPAEVAFRGEWPEQARERAHAPAAGA